MDQKATDELMRAMRESLHDVPPVNNIDGVRLFRLTSSPNAKRIIDLLFNPQGPLQALHNRVQEAGCSS